MPKELGGAGRTTLQQVLVQEQVGRVTNALGWVAATPPSWLPAVATPDQIDRYVRPAIAGDREECYAITEEGPEPPRGRSPTATILLIYEDMQRNVLAGYPRRSDLNAAGTDCDLLVLLREVQVCGRVASS